MSYIQRSNAMYKELRSAIVRGLPKDERQSIARRHGFFYGNPEDIKRQRLEAALSGEIFDPLYLGI